MGGRIDLMPVSHPLGAVARSPVVWIFLSAAAGMAVGYYLSRPQRYTPNRAVSSKRAKSELARSVARDKERRIRDDHRARARKLQADKRRVQRKVTKGCDAARKRTSAEVKAMRARERERINQKADATRAKTSKKCRARRERVRSVVDDALRLAQEEHDERLRLAKQLSAVERKSGKRIAAQERRQRRREEQSESDDEVESNIEAELVPVWRKVKRDIHGSPRMSRTEAFLHYVEENDDEVWAIRGDEMDRELGDLSAEQGAYYKQQIAG